MRTGVILAAMMVLGLAAPAKAQDAAAGLDERTVRVIRQTPERSMTQFLSQLLQIAPDGELTQDDIELHIRRQSAEARANELRQYLRFDLDGDLMLSGLEMLVLRPLMSPGDRVKLEVAFSTYDADGDGDLSTAELLVASVPERQGQMAERWAAEAGMLLQFDGNGDGRVTLTEITGGIREIAASEPAMQTPRAAVRPEKQPPQPATLKARCPLPEPTGEAKIILIGGYEGGALSTTTIAGQDTETEVATISVEEGDRPLYLLVSTYSNVIFRLEGAVERVERFVALEGRNRAGVTGLPADRIVLTADRDCGAQYFTKASERNARTATARASALTGRVPDEVIAAYTLGTVSLPSGEIVPEKQSHDGIDIVVHNGNRYAMTADGIEKVEDAPTKDDPAAGARAALNRFHPGGVIEIDPAQVVASGKAESYQVMPQEAGLIQLVEDGILEPAGRETYRIVGAMPRFPAGLNGAHQVKFILAKGVKMPAGSPGHSTIIDEATGACLKGPRCR